MQTIEMRAAARDTSGGFVPLVGQQLHVLFSRSADFVLTKLTGEMRLRIERMIARAANHEQRSIDQSFFFFSIYSILRYLFRYVTKIHECVFFFSLISYQVTKTFVLVAQQHMLPTR